MSDPTLTDKPAARRRRTRDELEALSRTSLAVPEASPPRGMSTYMLVVLGLVVFGMVAWLLSPRTDVARTHGVDSEAMKLQQRIKEDRERARRAQTEGNYLERSAAGEVALLKEFTQGGERLAAIADAAPADDAAANEAVLPSNAATPPSAATRDTASAPAETANAGTASAPAAVAERPKCRLYVSELSASGKLTYEDILQMKGARKSGSAGHVLTPPVNVNGREMIFEVAPDGCVNVARNNLAR